MGKVRAGRTTIAVKNKGTLPIRLGVGVIGILTTLIGVGSIGILPIMLGVWGH